ncbi:MAG: amidohydrolase family protein [Pirellulaceae bacterium]|nr:amidohydrolase family protein [Pirellulaceae bacterium]MDP6717571.1 amidohydrolase family protein [Pirellulaceae bacterium]
MSYRIAHYLLGIVVTLAASVFACGVVAAGEAVIALRGGTIESGSKLGRIDSGVVLLKGNKIDAVGKEVEIPDNARVIDVRGKTILPGIVDPYHVVSVGAGGAPAPRTVTINGRTFTIRSTGSTTSVKFLRIVDSFYPFGAKFRPLVRSGITTANLVASGYGQSALARMRIDDPEELVSNGEGLVYASVSNSATSLGLLRSGLASAAASSSSSSSSSTASRSTSRTSSRLSAVEQSLWKEIAAGRRPLFVNASNSATILHVLKLLKAHEQVKLVLIANGPNVYETLDQLKGRRVSLILSPTIDTAPNSRDRICVPRLLHEAKVEFAISLSISQSSLSSSQDAPLVPIAFLTKAGLPRDVAFAALTSVPAKLLGVQETHGSIEPKKLANLLVFDGDPLAPASRLERVFVEGRTVYED